MLGKKARGIKRSTFVIGPDGRLGAAAACHGSRCREMSRQRRGINRALLFWHEILVWHGICMRPAAGRSAARPVRCGARGRSSARAAVRSFRKGVVAIALASGFASGVGHAGVITLQNATATVLQDAFVVGQSIDGDSVSSFNGWAIGNGETNQTAVWESLADFGFASGTLLTITLFQNQGDFHTLGDFRLSVTADDRATFADGLPAGGDVSANWTILAPLSATSTNGATLTIRGDGSILASGTNPDTAVYTINALTDLVGITGLRLEAIEDPSLITEGPNGSGPGRQPTNGNFVLTEITLDATAIPEPVTLGLLGVGLAGLGFWRRRQ